MSRFITHIKRLENSEEAVAKFVSRAKILGEKLGLLQPLRAPFDDGEQPVSQRKNLPFKGEVFIVSVPASASRCQEVRMRSGLLSGICIRIPIRCLLLHRNSRFLRHL